MNASEDVDEQRRKEKGRRGNAGKMRVERTLLGQAVLLFLSTLVFS